MQAVLPALCLVVAAAVRLYGRDWDDGLWLHPDERQIYFVVGGLGWPSTAVEALGAESPLNPRFFAYGSLPIYLAWLAAQALAVAWPVLRDPGNLHLAARPLAALLDVGTVYLTYRLAVHLGTGRRQRAGTGEGAAGAQAAGGLLAAALYGLAALPIQSSHYYTADGLLTFLVMLGLNLACDVVLGAGAGRRVALGVAIGLALATKLSAAPMLVLIPVCTRLRSELGAQKGLHYEERSRGARLRGREGAGLAAGGAVLLAAVVTFLVVEPYALLDVRLFLAESLRESQIAWGRLDVPYTRQFAGTLPYLYSVWQTAVWGMGLPAGVLGWAGLGSALVRWLREGEWADSLLLAWAGPYLAVTGALYARPLRYMLPLVPVLCIVGARLWVRATGGATAAGRWWRAVGSGLMLVMSLAYAVALVAAYASPHPWVAASRWIYRHVPAGSTLAVEEWDMPLPLPIEVDGRARRSEEYAVRTLALYDEPDGPAKWRAIAGELASSDYLVVASRRLYGSIARLPDRYPVAGRYYELLLGGGLGFEPAGEFARGDGRLNPRTEPLPGAVPRLLVPDESLVVYDRPRVLLYRNASRLTAEEILSRLGLGEE